MKKIVLSLTLLTGLFFSGCATKETTITLLPEENGKVGVISLVDKHGNTTTIDKAYQSLEVMSDGNLKSAAGDDGEKIKRRYGELLDFIPKKPKSFSLFFDSGKEDTEGEQVEEFKKFAKEFINKRYSIVSIGNADSTGNKEGNEKISIKRAEFVKQLLIGIGFKEDEIMIKYYGDSNPLVKTAPGEGHPKNRRVDVVFR